jgi:hypothetical protein
MNVQPLYFEGEAVVTNVIGTGAAFVVTEHGDAYVAKSLTKAYNLSIGDSFQARVRRNHKDYEGSCTFSVIDVITTPTSSTSVTAQDQDSNYEDDEPTPWHKLSFEERWESIEALCDSTPMFTATQLIHDLGLEGCEKTYDHVADYLYSLTHGESPRLWNVTVQQNEGHFQDETKPAMLPDYFYDGYMIDPSKRFERSV